jgi:biotin synthase
VRALLIRASLGTAVALGLLEAKIHPKAVTKTAYLMQFSNNHCLANCAFCPQARSSNSATNKLSRVVWPKFDLITVLEQLAQHEKTIKRVCIQTVKFRQSTKNLLAALQAFKEKNLQIPLSVCMFPTSKKVFSKLKSLAVSRVGIAFDCATIELFNKIKGKGRGVNISWDLMEKTLQKAIDVFGASNVSTHLIIGLGETEQEAVQFLQKFLDQGITIGLFAFTPIKGTDLCNQVQPNLQSYRRVQLALYLLVTGETTIEEMAFSEEKGEILDFGVSQKKILQAIQTGKPFQTTGCPSCNRPFYNESPGTDLYNFPWEPTEEEINRIVIDFQSFFKE